MRAWVAAVSCVVLISCGGGGAGGSATGGAGGLHPGSGGGGSGGAATGGSAAAGAGGSTVDGGAGGVAGASGGASGAAGMMTLRVAHGFLPLGATTGPAIDIYDDMYNTGLQASVSGKPIISGLAYGTMSSYVNPRFVDMEGTAVLLTALPAGSPPDDLTDARTFWSGTDDGSHPQVTVLIYPDGSSNSGSPLDGLGTTAFFEKGDDTFTGNMGPLAPAPPSGQGEYLVATESIEPLQDFLNASNEQYYFFVDDSCTPALNGDTSTPIAPLIWAAVGPTSEFADFAATPGTHNVSVAPWGDATSPTCDQLLPLRQGTTPLAVATGQQMMVFVDGSSLSDLHLLTGPIAP